MIEIEFLSTEYEPQVNFDHFDAIYKTVDEEAFKLQLRGASRKKYYTPKTLESEIDSAAARGTQRRLGGKVSQKEKSTEIIRKLRKEIESCPRATFFLIES